MAQTEGHDGPGLCDQLVPGIAAVIDEVVIRGEDAVGEPAGRFYQPRRIGGFLIRSPYRGSEAAMSVQSGLFDVDDRLRRLSDLGDQLEAFATAVDFEIVPA
jgi:hypothetical protein